jgi:hypothetical protein
MNPRARRINWERTTEYCCLHEAEVSIIPLGIQKGYPQQIAFRDLEKRLEEDWIRKDLLEIVRDPTRSEWFGEAVDEIESEGALRWRSVEWQGVAEVQGRMMTG